MKKSWRVVGLAAFTASTLAFIGGCTVSAPASQSETSVAPSSPPEPGLGANPAGTGESASATIDNDQGGSVALPDGSELIVPPGALPPGVDTITVTSTPTPAPADYATVTPVYRFEPDGTVFLKPLTIKMPFSLATDQTPEAHTVLWSRQRAEGYDMVATKFEAGSASGEYWAVAEVTHFSTGMVGKRYTTDPHPAPDPYGD